MYSDPSLSLLTICINIYIQDFNDDVDEFEAKHNFRFEEPGANNILTYPRTIEDSVRNKASKRKLAREAKKKRKAEELAKKAEKLKQIKNQKKKEILDRLKKIESLSGNTVEVCFFL